ncbi:hypothetical protein P5673_033403 [Acropora cervicornis]|uniref:Uncharacterized protein n=1 Tax=Acropora cervicornis TaxID=6130 RepID=A0AAD9PPX4_ACRCE|nr:hypothetical protein P5673_033403 [Acropora cervicornis]
MKIHPREMLAVHSGHKMKEGTFIVGQPIRRVLHFGTIGTTALATCFPKLRL